MAAEGSPAISSLYATGSVLKPGFRVLRLEIMIAAAPGTMPALGEINRARRDTMIWRLLPFGLVAILVAGILVSDFLACRLGHIAMGEGK